MKGVQWEVSYSLAFKSFDLTRSKKCILQSFTTRRVLLPFHLIIIFNARCDSITDYMAHQSFSAPIFRDWLKGSYSHNE